MKALVGRSLGFALLPAMFALSAIGCGGGAGSNSTPTAPGPPAPPVQQNRVPTLTSMSVSPDNGMSQLTSFVFNAAATDADGDQLTYTWDFGDGLQGTGTALTKIYNGSGQATVKVTVADGKGGSASDTRTVVVKSMNGAWRSTQADQNIGTFTFTLTQNGGAVTGAYSDSSFGAGRIDPAQPGRVDTAGVFEMRVKQGRFTDFTFRGTLDPSGTRATGGVFGSGFNGQPFTMVKN